MGLFGIEGEGEAQRRNTTSVPVETVFSPKKVFTNATHADCALCHIKVSWQHVPLCVPGLGKHLCARDALLVIPFANSVRPRLAIALVCRTTAKFRLL